MSVLIKKSEQSWLIVRIVFEVEWNAWILCFNAFETFTLSFGTSQVDFQYAVVMWSLRCPKTTNENVNEVQNRIFENCFGFL